MMIATLFDKPVVTVSPHAPLRTAAALMREHNVGAVVVVQQDAPVGIVTDRDIALAVGEAGFTAEQMVRQVMSAPVEVLDHRDGVFDAARRMKELGVRRLPVVGPDGALVGLISLDDLVLAVSQTLGQMADGVRPALRIA